MLWLRTRTNERLCIGIKYGHGIPPYEAAIVARGSSVPAIIWMARSIEVFSFLHVRLVECRQVRIIVTLVVETH